MRAVQIAEANDTYNNIKKLRWTKNRVPKSLGAAKTRIAVLGENLLVDNVKLEAFLTKEIEMSKRHLKILGVDFSDETE